MRANDPGLDLHQPMLYNFSFLFCRFDALKAIDLDDQN